MRSRVLQFIGNLNQGGTERQALALSAALAANSDYDISIATLDADGHLRGEAEAIDPRLAEYRLSSFYDLNFVRQLWRCAADLRRNKIDLVHTHDFYSNVFGTSAALLAGIKVRITSKRETGGMRTHLQAATEKASFARSHAVVANSNAVCDHLVSLGVEPSKINTIYNGIDTTRFDTATNDLSGLPDGRLITLVANLRHDVKNVPMLLRAAQTISRQHADAAFVIAGEGDLEPSLKALAAELRVADRVHFVGRCDDVPSLLAASYACVLTSTNEGFSNSILEYMAAGKPVIATDVGGAREAVTDGETGFVVASEDDAALAEKLSILLNDKGLAQRFGDAGRNVAQLKFSREAQLKNTVDLYEHLLSLNK